MTDLNPHRQQMADESMVRTLDAQARAIWPQESPLIERYGLGAVHWTRARSGTRRLSVSQRPLAPTCSSDATPTATSPS